MSAFLSRFERGKSLRDTFDLYRMNKIVDRLNANRSKFVGRGVRVQTGPGGEIHTLPRPLSNATPIPIFPYEGTDASDTTAGKVTVQYGTHNNVPPTIDGIQLTQPPGTAPPKLTLGADAQCVYVEYDFTFDVTGAITGYTGNTVNSTNDPFPPANVLTFASDGSGTGSLYQTLFAVAVATPSVPGGSYSVEIDQNIYASQIFAICGNQIFVSNIGTSPFS
jgi:hypothetical protein